MVVLYLSGQKGAVELSRRATIDRVLLGQIMRADPLMLDMCVVSNGANWYGETVAAGGQKSIVVEDHGCCYCVAFCDQYRLNLVL